MRHLHLKTGLQGAGGMGPSMSRAAPGGPLALSAWLQLSPLSPFPGTVPGQVCRLQVSFTAGNGKKPAG